MAMGAGLLIGSTACSPPSFAQQHTSKPTAMDSKLPAAIGTRKSSGAPVSYPGKRIFDYMDGAGEVYRAYDFQDLLVQRYTCPGQEEILVEFFDMGSPRNAFGVFTYMKGRGPAVQIGQDAEYKSGLLCFWKGRYFVCVQIDKENETARNDILDLGRVIAGAIREEGDRPALLQCLPEGEYLPETLRFFFRHEILDSHYPVGEENPLLLDERTEGVLVRLKHGRSHLLVVGYRDRSHLDSAYSAFVSRSMPGAESTGIYTTESGSTTACAKAGQHFIIVFDSPTSELATHILDTVRRKLP